MLYSETKLTEEYITHLEQSMSEMKAGRQTIVIAYHTGEKIMKRLSFDYI